MVQRDDLEKLADEVRRIAGLQDDELELAATIAARFLGRSDAVVLAPRLSGPAYLRETETGYQILVRPDATDINFHVAHELGHLAIRALTNLHLHPEEEERAANFIGAAILAPARMVDVAYRQWGERLRPMARAFGLSQTSIVLRLSEVRGDERAVVTKNNHVLVPSQCVFPWADASVIAVARGVRRSPDLAKAKLVGGIDEGRVAVRVK